MINVSTRGSTKSQVKPIDFEALFQLMENTVPEDLGVKREHQEAALNSETQEIDLTPLQEVVNVSLALNTWHDAKIFTKALQHFANDNKTIVSQIQSTLDNSDKTEAKRLVHGLKGVSGNLRITNVFENRTGARA